MYNAYSMRHQRGMQVHAVPEAERANDSTGRRLPWGYEYSNNISQSTETERREPTEKGAFGTTGRRPVSRSSRSRSKTAEPRGEIDKNKAENLAYEEQVFGSMRKAGPKDDGRRDGRDAPGDDSSAAQHAAAARPAATAALETDSEPTEVLLCGFGKDMQWAAIDFYERVSNGSILEDYERTSAALRSGIPRPTGRPSYQKSLSRAAMKKKNTFRGGEHWIKVTFDSRQAAELAISRSPHTIRGCLVYAEYFTGAGPQKDEPILATQAGAQITSEALPTTFAINSVGGSPNGSSTTATSATATAPSTGTGIGLPPWNTPWNADSPVTSSSTIQTDAPVAQPPTAGSSSFQQQQVRTQSQAQLTRRGRIEGTIRANVLPMELALAPKQPKASWSSWLGASEIIGSSVPRKADGTFAWDQASLYWRIFWWIDTVLGTDFCGLRADE